MPGGVSVDRWLWQPVAVSLSVAAGLFLISGIPGDLGFFGPFIAFAVFAIGAIALAILAVIQAVRKRPRRAVSLALAIFAPVVLAPSLIWTAECVHVGLTVGIDMMQPNGPQKPNASGFQTYDWSTGMVGNVNTMLIHDARPHGAKPVATVENHIAGMCEGTAEHLIGRYFTCEFY